MIDEDDDDQKNVPPPINRFSETVSFNRSKKKNRFAIKEPRTSAQATETPQEEPK